jgi:hypothetical protein
MDQEQQPKKTRMEDFEQKQEFIIETLGELIVLMRGPKGRPEMGLIHDIDRLDKKIDKYEQELDTRIVAAQNNLDTRIVSVESRLHKVELGMLRVNWTVMIIMSIASGLGVILGLVIAYYNLKK